MSERYDAIILGGGHNGLTCGAYLARAGLATVVLERRPVIGGAAVTEEIVPGFRFSVFSYLMSLLHPKVIADLELRSHGFEVLPATDMFGPIPGGNHIVFSDSVEKTQQSFARFSRKDADVYPEFDRYLMESVVILRKILLETPPDPSCRDWKSFKQTAAFLWKYRRVRGKLFRLIDLFTMSADDYLSEWFESTHVKAVLAYYCGIGTFVGPKSPGSAYVVTHHLMGEHAGAGGWGFIRGGMGTITQAIAAYGRSKGLEDPHRRRSDRDRHRRRQGHRRHARRRHAHRGADRRQQRQREAHLPQVPAACRAARGVRARRRELPDLLDRVQDQHRVRAAAGVHGLRSGGVRLRLSDLHAHRPDDRVSRAGLRRRQSAATGRAIRSSPSSRRASSTTRSARPASTSCTCSAAMRPTRCAKATGRRGKDDFAKNVLRVVDEHAPGFSDGIIGMQVLTPPDIEAIIGSPHGHIFHGELQVDQLFFARPAPHYADYRSPIRGLYQCGSSAHPGGGVGGVVGHNAAREILKDLGR